MVSQKRIMTNYLLSVIVIVIIVLQEQLSWCVTLVRSRGAFEALLSLKLNNFKTVQAMTAKLSDVF